MSTAILRNRLRLNFYHFLIIPLFFLLPFTLYPIRNCGKIVSYSATRFFVNNKEVYIHN